MRRSMFGAVVGLILGVVWVFAGFWSMVLVAILTIIGGLIGQYGHIDRKHIKQKINQFLSS
ncbi:DUF2273 domain-containing protein [Furfurilactobacillus sp. WILCCON 0119]|uniref:DUF2273 domain-containing protein n=1 Tax=Furfurilactobacillus entadae TaxID=2922307 RepID=UPI0035E8A280